MPSYLLDTNFLLRLAQPADAQHAVATAAVRTLRADAANTLFIVPQCLYELWVVATRPPGDNGLGRTAADAQAMVEDALRLFPLLRDVPPVYDHWLRLVTAASTVGFAAHDGRLVAAMMAHGLTHLLTFNFRHFRRYEAPAGITVVDPASLRPAAPPSPTGS